MLFPRSIFFLHVWQFSSERAFDQLNERIHSRQLEGLTFTSAKYIKVRALQPLRKIYIKFIFCGKFKIVWVSIFKKLWKRGFTHCSPRQRRRIWRWFYLETCSSGIWIWVSCWIHYWTCHSLSKKVELVLAKFCGKIYLRCMLMNLNPLQYVERSWRIEGISPLFLVI